MKRLLGAALASALAAPLPAASPTAWEMTTYQDFLKGRFEGVALSRDGRLHLAPRLETAFDKNQAAVWAAVRTADGAVWTGTGHRGKVYRVDAAGKAEEIFTAPEPEIFALAAGAGGVVWAATSPNGKIYRIENRKAKEAAAPGARYIWALAVGPDGTVYAGTGDEGKIWRITPGGAPEVWYETGEAHVTSLAIDGEGHLLAGTEPNGIVYRITGRDRAFALYDAPLPEIRTLLAAADGSVYVAAMGGSVQKQAQPAASSGVPLNAPASAPATTITITEDAQTPGGDLRPRPAQTVSTPAAQQSPLTTVTELSGVEKSAVYRIRADNTVETLWTSREENAYDIALAGADVLIATDNQGRLFRVDPRRRTTLVAETRDAEALRLVAGPTGTLVATGNPGRLYRLGSSPGGQGTFESPVHDATTTARWGRLAWRADGCGGCRLVLRTRSGNSGRPDRTWSDWSEPLADPNGSRIRSPNARFIQWKAEITGTGAATPMLDSVRLAYLPQNTAPEVKSITVSAQSASTGAKPAGTTATATPTYSITVTDTGEAGASSSTGTATQLVTRASVEQLLITWVAEDLDADKLVYSVEFRGEGESRWKVLKADLAEASHTVDTETFADGVYFFRVTVSDAGANPAADARWSELVSAPVLIDRTPPVVRAAAAGNEIRATILDAASPLRRAEYSVDAGAWAPLGAADGVLDSLEESVVIRLPAANAEQHVVIRAFDQAGNAGLAKLVIR